jgi:hypothetical protein
VIKISLTCGGRKSGASLFQSDRHMVTPPAGHGTRVAPGVKCGWKSKE